MAFLRGRKREDGDFGVLFDNLHFVAVLSEQPARDGRAQGNGFARDGDLTGQHALIREHLKIVRLRLERRLDAYGSLGKPPQLALDGSPAPRCTIPPNPAQSCITGSPPRPLTPSPAQPRSTISPPPPSPRQQIGRAHV